MLDRDRFNEEFEWFRRLIPRWDEGRAFTSFDEGVVGEIVCRFVNSWKGPLSVRVQRPRDLQGLSVRQLLEGSTDSPNEEFKPTAARACAG